MPDLGPPLARGRTAEIYPWGDGRVLKLFLPEFSTDAGLEEWLTHLVCRRGVPAPNPGGLLQVNNRWGLIFERIDGVTMMEYMQRRPWLLLRCARLLAELHAHMHNQPGSGLPAQKASLLRQIHRAKVLSPELAGRIERMLAALPEEERLCHSDFHPLNVLMARRGPVIIDWVTAVSGNPMADVARTSMILRKVALPRGTPFRSLFQAARKWLNDIYLKRYFSLRPAGREQLKAWEPVIAAARLAEGVLGEQDALLRFIQSSL